MVVQAYSSVLVVLTVLFEEAFLLMFPGLRAIGSLQVLKGIELGPHRSQVLHSHFDVNILSRNCLICSRNLLWFQIVYSARIHRE